MGLEALDSMLRTHEPSVFLPVLRAVGQFDDRAFHGILLRSVAWSIGCFAALHIGSIWAINRLLALHGWLAWSIDVLGSIAASILALWLFLPVAVVIGTLYFDRIAGAVELKFYPWLPPPRGAPLLEQAWDGVEVAVKVLALNIAGLLLAFLLPGIGFLLSWSIAAYAIGRGLFVAVAMRRMPRAAAESLYRSRKGTVLVQGAILALAGYIPLLDLLIPIIGVAAMVHIVDMALTDNNTN